ncbi:MAG: hypothetical protein LIO93_00815 [Bacteroidales bacterium]|nr:hypothetical protein [Bacteroidales bacterium]
MTVVLMDQELLFQTHLLYLDLDKLNMRFYTLLVSFVFPFWLYAQDNTQITAIYDEYEAGRRIVKEIVTENNLEDSLKGYAYGGYFVGPSLFLIIKEADSFFEIYQGERGKGILNIHKFNLEDKRLSSLFSWTRHDEIIYDVQSSEYTAIYYYFVLYDENHDKKLEFNISTMSAYKDAEKSKKYGKILPFTTEQQTLIWELFGFF